MSESELFVVKLLDKMGKTADLGAMCILRGWSDGGAPPDSIPRTRVNKKPAMNRNNTKGGKSL